MRPAGTFREGSEKVPRGVERRVEPEARLIAKGVPSRTKVSDLSLAYGAHASEQEDDKTNRTKRVSSWSLA